MNKELKELTLSVACLSEAIGERRWVGARALLHDAQARITTLMAEVNELQQSEPEGYNGGQREVNNDKRATNAV